MQVHQPSPLQYELALSSEARATLTHYPAGGRQPRHEHSETHVSFLLAGELVELLDGREYRLSGSSRGVKPAGVVHADVWGVGGALFLTLQLQSTADYFLDLETPGWASVWDQRLLASLARTMFEQCRSADFHEAIADLLSLASAPPKPLRKAPAWLVRARDEITDEPDGSTLHAAVTESGVHRTHFSRMFNACFGLPPSLYRRQVQLARAIQSVARSPDRLCAIAHDCGYFDQAHMTRSVVSATGLAPGYLRSLLTGATHIQASTARNG